MQTFVVSCANVCSASFIRLRRPVQAIALKSQSFLANQAFSIALRKLLEELPNDTLKPLL